MVTRYLLGLYLISFASWKTLVAQTMDTPLDPAGYVSKYDTSFRGIGPKVYVLPAPRTKKEVLTDVYREITSFRDTIHQAIRYQKLLGDIRSTSNALAAQHLIQTSVSAASWQDSLLHQTLWDNKATLAYGLLNEYAKFALLKKDIKSALTYLKQGLNLATQHGNMQDQSTFHANISTVYIISQNPTEAIKHEQIFYKTALANKSLVEQAQSLIKQSMIYALNQEYGSAENTIIRQAIPLLNRARFYSGKIWAWEMLADIYQAQHKHTEAQWFLIQARDLAQLHKLEDERAEIEYMLAYSKYTQENFRIAKGEFISAYDLAEKEDNKLLKLAIVEKLGNIYLIQNHIKNAEEMLAEYWSLREHIL